MVRVEQPYRVAGRRSPAPAAALDQAWVVAVAAARDRIGTHVPMIAGGRSSGARVAARTVQATGAAGLLALAFPLRTPRGVSRQPELDAVDVPVLILQGDRDRFGMPSQAPRRRVHVLIGADHAMRRHGSELSTVALAFLAEVLGQQATLAGSRHSAAGSAEVDDVGRGQPDQIRGGEFDLQATPARADEDCRVARGR